MGPFESDLLRSSIPKNYLQTIYDVCLWSGMRYVEVQRFYDHPEWWMTSRKCIHLPEEAQKKVKRKQLERYVHPIPAQLESVLSYFHDNPKPPSLQAWNQNLARWSEKSGLNSFRNKCKKHPEKHRELDDLCRSTITCGMFTPRTRQLNIYAALPRPAIHRG